MQTISARWQRKGRRGHTPRLIVVHCTVSREMGTGAEAVARYFATAKRPGSSHVVTDNNSSVRCVADTDTAYGAAGANDDGLHLELVGLPDQSREQWLDPWSTAMLHQAAPIIQEWSTIWDIPLVWLTVAQVADGHTRGLCTHDDVSKAFPAVSTGHWDPGPHFPKNDALRIWTPTPQEDDIVRATYVRRADDPQVWLAAVGMTPRPVVHFADVEYHFVSREGGVLLDPPADASHNVTDGAGVTRKVMVVADGTLFGI
jgi:hypothetical protein